MAVTANIQIGGNVEGNIVVGNHNFVVNTNHGTIVYKQAAPQVRVRQFSPKPPRAPRGFVNRSDELAKLESWIAAHEIVLLHAPDGMGKTSLLKQVANSAAAVAMPNGIILLEAVDVDGQALGPTDILQRLFDALFESAPPLKVDSVSARTYLSNTGPLVLFDEVPLPASLLRALPDFFPQGAILMSTDLPLSGEYQHLPVGPLPRKEAMSLLANRASIQIGEDTRGTFNLLCARLGDVSLAITICANVMRELHISPEVALREIQELSGSAPKPGAELELMFTFAFSKLRPQEQKILSAAALTPGISMTPEWLDTALGGEPSTPFIERLKALGLLFENSPRLRLPPGFLPSARRAAVLEEQVVLSRLADYLLGIAEKNLQNWEFFREELGNLSGVLSWALRTRNWVIITRLARALDPYLSLHGLWDAWREALDSLLSAAQQTGDQAAEAWAFHQLGTREMGLGAREQALDFLGRALDIRRALGDIVGMSYTQHNINFLIPPPSGPGGNKPKPPSPGPPRKVPVAGSNSLLLIGAFGAIVVIGLVGLLLLAILIGPRFFAPPPPTVTQTPFLLPTDNTPTPVPATLTPTQPTATPIPTDTELVPLTPTPIGGSGWLAYVSDSLRIPNIALIEIGKRSFILFASTEAADSPDWNPNDEEFDILAYGSGNSDGTAIVTRHANGLDQTYLTGYTENYYPTWSPDGQKIAFVSVQDGNADIYVIDAQGEGEPIRLTTDPAWDADPSWSPDSQLIAFASNRDGGDGFQIYVMNAEDGTKQARLPNNRPIGTWNSFPNWSPDGSQIVFQSRDNSESLFQIYVMSTLREDTPVQLTFEGNNELAEWSPDSKLIAFTSNRDGNNEVYMMSADGSEQTNLTNDPANDNNPTWLYHPVPDDCWLGCGMLFQSGQ